MEEAMAVDTGQPKMNAHTNGYYSMPEERRAAPGIASSTMNDNAPANRRSRPTRESVLQRLSEALLRRSLTKIDLSQRGLRPSDARLVKMALFQNSHLSILQLGYNNLGDEGVTILAPGIASHKTLASLDLGFNNIGDQGCRALAIALSSCKVHTLYMAGNVFGEDGACALAGVIKCSIKRLHLTGNRIGPDGVKAITEAVIGEQQENEDAEPESDRNICPLDYGLSPELPVSAGLQELFLGGTGMGRIGSKSVARMLECSTTLRVISLANCSIGDVELEFLATSIKRNREKLPLEALQLSFNDITCKGLDSLMNAIWGSSTLRELLLDNNDLRDRGAEQVAAILPHLKTLAVLDIGFNSIKSCGMGKLMKVVAETHHLVSLSVSGNPIDTDAAKLVSYALAYNQSLKSLSLVHCSIDHRGQRRITAGIASNRRTALRKLTGFSLGPIIMTIKFPAAMEHWSNEQVLNFLHLMWEQTDERVDGPSGENEIDPLHFLPQAIGKPSGNSRLAEGPLDASIVVEVARRTFESLQLSGQDGISIEMGATYYEPSFGSPLAEDATILEETDEGLQKVSADKARVPFRLTLGKGDAGRLTPTDPMLSNQSASFVAPPSSPTEPSIPDPARKQRIVDWLCKNIQHLNQLAQLPFNSRELWKLHQHYFTPVVNETGGGPPSPSMDDMSRMVSSVPEVTCKNAASVEPCTVTTSTQSSDDFLFMASSYPSLPASPQGASLPILKRKVSYHFLVEAAMPTPTVRPEGRYQKASVSKLIEGGAAGHSMPPKSKRARRNKTRISFLPRIKEKLDSYLDTCHEKALILMRQLFYVEQALLSSNINPCPPNCEKGRPTHLFGVLADEAQMILLDMI